MTPNLSVDPDGLLRVAAALDTVAGRLNGVVGARFARLTPSPVGGDEVSSGVAAALDRAARELESDASAGARETRAFAAALRAHAQAMAEADADAMAPSTTTTS